MMGVIKYLPVLLLVVTLQLSAQTRKVVYHPCFLMDSVDKNLAFIKQYSSRIFTDSVECKQTLLDSIARRYISTKNIKYLDALSVIKQNPLAKVDELYTDITKRIIESDFDDYIEKLYAAHGRFMPLESELIVTLNMIVDGQPLKQKYMGLLNVAISSAMDEKDKYKQAYFEKLKVRINTERH